MDTVKFVDGIGQVYDDITDAFDRTVSNGWGSTDTGQAWTVEGTASNYNVGSSEGLHTHTTAGNTRQSTVDVGHTDMSVNVSMHFPDSTAAVATMDQVVAVRLADASNHYKAKVLLGTDGSLKLQLFRRMGGVDSQLGSDVTLTASYSANQFWRVRLEAVGPYIRCRGWLASSAEPTTWSLTAYDDNLTAGTNAALFSSVTTGNTDVPLTLGFGSITITSPVQVRLDLNDGEAWGLKYEGTDMSPPPLRRASTASLMRDGETYPATAYGNRALRLRLDMLGSSVDDVAARTQQLARELDRVSNYLMWQPDGATHPVFFKTCRADITRITDYPGPGTLKTLDVVIPAEPFALGLRESLGGFTVTGDPPAVYFDVTGVKGDVEVPLQLILDDFLPEDQPALFATRRWGTPSSVPHSHLPATWTLGTDASLSGARLLIDFGSDDTLIRRATWDLAALPSPDLRGRYRPFVKVDIDTSGTFQIELIVDGMGTNGSNFLTFSTDGLLRLPDIYLPLGLPSDATHTEGMVVAPPEIGLNISRASGSSDLYVDYVLLIPVDDQTAIAGMVAAMPSGWSPGGTYTEGLVWDESGAWYPHRGGVAVTADQPMSRAGATQLHVSPNVTNRVYFLSSIASGPDVQPSYVLDASYLPRYLRVRPASS